MLGCCGACKYTAGQSAYALCGETADVSNVSRYQLAAPIEILSIIGFIGQDEGEKGGMFYDAKQAVLKLRKAFQQIRGSCGSEDVMRVTTGKDGLLRRNHILLPMGPPLPPLAV